MAASTKRLAGISRSEANNTTSRGDKMSKIYTFTAAFGLFIPAAFLVLAQAAQIVA